MSLSFSPQKIKEKSIFGVEFKKKEQNPHVAEEFMKKKPTSTSIFLAEYFSNIEKGAPTTKQSLVKQRYLSLFVCNTNLYH